jgi:hypothetical protein
MSGQTTPSKDPGLQPERTGLAWSRTGFLALIVACLSLRIGVHTEAVISLLVTLLLAALGCVCLHRGHQRPLYSSGDEVVTPRHRWLLLTTSSVVVIASATHIALLLARHIH